MAGIPGMWYLIAIVVIGWIAKQVIMEQLEKRGLFNKKHKLKGRV